MHDGFDVDTEVLRRHAQRLRMVTDQVAVAADAARSVDLHSGAFGLLCSFLPAVLNGAEVAVGDSVTAAGETIDSACDGVVAMARDYEAVDDRTHARLTRLGEILG